MLEADPNAPFVERFKPGLGTDIFAYSFAICQARLPMRSEVWANTKAHWSPAAMEQRAKNRKIYLDKKYPLRPQIVLPGDKEWPN